MTIVVAPYVELKKQLTTRCTDAGIDCMAWPEARDFWPRVVIVSAESAGSDDFLQWAADVASRERLDRVVIDECHLAYTAAYEYRTKLLSLSRLRGLACPFVFLTGTLPPLDQHDFEEAMRLRNPLYIRASSHRLKVRYSVVRVGNGRGQMEVRRLVEARAATLRLGEKGVVYCKSHAKCKALARLLDCHYYYRGDTRDIEAHRLAQRTDGFQAWVQGKAPYIVATSALGTGIDVPGIVYVIHVEAPYSIIDYAQEAGRAGRAGELVTAIIVIEERDWPAEDPKGDACLTIKEREVGSLVRTKGCRRRVMGQCLDSDVRDCRGLGTKDEAVRCDNCEQQELAWKSEPPLEGVLAMAAHGTKSAIGLERIEAALSEVAALGAAACRPCWVFEGSSSAQHSWYTCGELEESLSFSANMEFMRRIDYRKDPRARFLSCFHCHVSQKLCTDGYQTKGTSCKWKQVVIPVALAACHDDDLWEEVQRLAGKELRGHKEYAAWLSSRHAKPLYGHEITNAIAVFDLVIDWRIKEAIPQMEEVKLAN